MTDNSSFVSSNEMYESLSTDKDKIIDKLSQRLEPHIENRELIKVKLFISNLLKIFFIL